MLLINNRRNHYSDIMRLEKKKRTFNNKKKYEKKVNILPTTQNNKQVQKLTKLLTEPECTLEFLVVIVVHVYIKSMMVI
jgi:hypothetical protein